jgi:hypothetical protein
VKSKSLTFSNTSYGWGDLLCVMLELVSLCISLGAGRGGGEGSDA